MNSDMFAKKITYIIILRKNYNIMMMTTFDFKINMFGTNKQNCKHLNMIIENFPQILKKLEYRKQQKMLVTFF